jgi:drug/metabolite transporter (DMT)-like permease
MVILFALLAALANAVNEATQHVASIAAPRRSSGWQLVVYLFRSPLWLFGWVALIAAFVFQALALHDGLISVVQPLLATELVFMLVLRRFWIRQSIRPVTWVAAMVTCVGLAVFVAAGQPGGGQRTPVSHHWLSAGLACCAAAAVLAVLARWGSPGLRAALYASASAVMWALVATFIKATTDTLTQFGVGSVRPLARVRPGRGERGSFVPGAGGAARRAAADLPAVPGDRRSDRQHRAERVAVRGTVHI